MLKKNKRFLYLLGILLTCQLTLAACQLRPQQKNSQEPKKHQKAKATKSKKATKATKKRKGKMVAGIDKPTDDGFLLTDESQIERKTDTGIIVKHGDHKHFFFYSDLKDSKWAYLIPKNHKEAAAPTSMRSVISAAGSWSRPATSDGYVFNPRDIVAEDANGYTVRHGDHYHYILKSSLGLPLVQQLARTTYPAPSTPPLIHRPGGIPGLDYPTSDGFLFDGTNISGKTASSILVNHGGHLHPISFDELRNSKWAHLVDQYKPSAEKNRTKPAEEADYQEKLAYLAKALKMDPSQLKKVHVSGQVGIEYPHEDHKHVVLLKDIDMTKPFETPEDKILEKKDGETIEARRERLVREYMEHFKVSRDAITIDGNYMSVRHGDHSHVYKIDPDLPDDPERDVKTETTNLEVEVGKIYGPFYTEGTNDALSRNAIHSKYKVTGIKNIKNFISLQFSTNSPYGDLEIDGKKVKRIYYLVRKDLNWEELNLTLPKAIQKDDRIFKGWQAQLPTSGKMAREHQAFYADFDKVKQQPTKGVYGPNDDVSSIDLTNYATIRYSSIANGLLRLNGHTQGGFIYYVNTNLTWKEAKAQGLVVPGPVPNNNYEFIEFRNVVLGGEKETDKVSSMISLAAFGTTATYIGPYVAKNPDNPTDSNDPSRHPNYYWHNPEKYVAVAFKAGENGELISRIGRSKAIVYLIRKGHSLESAKILPPTGQGKTGYHSDPLDETFLSNYNKPITEDITYTLTFSKVGENRTTTPSGWWPSDDDEDLVLPPVTETNPVPKVTSDPTGSAVLFEKSSGSNPTSQPNQDPSLKPTDRKVPEVPASKSQVDQAVAASGEQEDKAKPIAE